MTADTDTELRRLLCLLSNLDKETKVPLSADLFASRPSRMTLWRWRMIGVKAPDGTRVKLEYFWEGGSLCTTVEAVRRFIQLTNGGK